MTLLQVTETATAKINLCLHVTGKRADGYHLLDSLVAFADFGDEIIAEPAEALSLDIIGPQAAGLGAGEDNLVLRAARFLNPGGSAKITLVKRLPIASGIGGGSADAAATLRALARLWAVPLPMPALTARLGADVPACLLGRALRMEGIGEVLTPAPPLPMVDVLLVNPGVAVSTPAVFSALHRADNPSLPCDLPAFATAAALGAWLAEQRNDLQAPAITLAPQIAQVLADLRHTGCLFAGMSGSGATCFALYAPDGKAARSAKEAIQARHPEWWAMDGRLS
jgi:4-diphosphocytidyl-2-C-methyl-D-erythritol kinase